MKVSINRSPRKGPYGGGNLFVRELSIVLENLGHKVTFLPDRDSDILFLIDPRPDAMGYSINEAVQIKNFNPKVKIIQRINECDARKNTEHMDPLLLQCSQLIDHTVFVSEWMQNYFLTKGWLCQSHTVLKNGVADYFLSLGKDKKSTKNKKLKIVTHHWSNNILKGFDVYNFLDYLCSRRNDIEFTYIGRHRDTFSNTKCIPPLSGPDLAKELSLHDVYISGSRFDPGPNHILESIAVGLPTYVHSEGGGAVEFAGQEMVFSNFEELEKIINKDSHKQNRMKPTLWKNALSGIDEIL